MKTTITTAEAFYHVFCALPKQTRLAVARQIFQNDDIRHSLELGEMPNEQTLAAFAEDAAAMPSFKTIDALREDLLS